jgi:hypothetical protein
MKNSDAIARLLSAAETAQDPLDELACRRAGAWLRWCDGFGATLTRHETERFAAGGALGEAARGLLRRLAETYPAPPEDARLDYLADDSETTSGLQDIARWSAATTKPGRSRQDGDTFRTALVRDPFGAGGIRQDLTDLPAPDPWS